MAAQYNLQGTAVNFVLSYDDDNLIYNLVPL